MVKDADLVLLQEYAPNGLLSPSMKAAVDLKWAFSVAFKLTGVATGSPQTSSHTEVFTSNVTEPIMRTNKSMIYSRYFIEGSEDPILVINVHAINFVRQNKFESHMRQIIDRIRMHDGPVIVAGDFNTWSGARRKFLDDTLEAEGLEYIHGRQNGYLKLDHIFARGFKLNEVLDTTDIASSDHKPLMVQLELK